MLLSACLLHASLALAAPLPVAPAAPILTAIAPAAVPLAGFWMQEDGAVIEIVRQGTSNGYVGRYAAFRKDPAAPKARKLLGQLLLKDLKPDGDKLTGKVIDPDSGKEYTTELVATDPGTMEMRVKVMGLVARKVIWKRQTSATN